MRATKLLKAYHGGEDVGDLAVLPLCIEEKQTMTVTVMTGFV